MGKTGSPVVDVRKVGGKDRKDMVVDDIKLGREGQKGDGCR